MRAFNVTGIINRSSTSPLGEWGRSWEDLSLSLCLPLSPCLSPLSLPPSLSLTPSPSLPLSLFVSLSTLRLALFAQPSDTRIFRVPRIGSRTLGEAILSIHRTGDVELSSLPLSPPPSLSLSLSLWVITSSQSHRGHSGPIRPEGKQSRCKNPAVRRPFLATLKADAKVRYTIITGLVRRGPWPRQSATIATQWASMTSAQQRERERELGKLYFTRIVVYVQSKNCLTTSPR